MNKSDFFYELPGELIAQVPLTPRDSSRLLVVNRNDGSLAHKHFYDLTDYLTPGDVLVVNHTRVLPARIFAQKADSGAKIEILLLKRLALTRWEVLLKPLKRVKIGTALGITAELKAVVAEFTGDGKAVVEFEYSGVFEDIIHRAGEMPLPHYIKTRLDDPERYQTVYGKIEGSAAAPTAGLHFTPGLLDKIRANGVEVVEVLLNVGLGTFRPVKADNIQDHIMHSEYYSLSAAAAESINRARSERRRVIAVGTTSVRVLETVAQKGLPLSESAGDTDIFIFPPYEFKIVDALITNFHLPESTLIMLVSAFLGRERTLAVYNAAIRERYRFFSFGDAMIIL